MADKKEGGIFKIALNLILTCLVSGCIIGVVYFITGPTATAKAEQNKQDSMKALVPDADKNSFLLKAKQIRSSLKKAAKKSLSLSRRLLKATAARLKC